MADVIDYKIYGSDLQLVEIELDPDVGVRAEVGTMVYMEQGTEVQTTTGGGLFAGFKRMLFQSLIGIQTQQPPHLKYNNIFALVVCILLK